MFVFKIEGPLGTQHSRLVKMFLGADFKIKIQTFTVREKRDSILKYVTLF
jgi:hypothetical protein